MKPNSEMRARRPRAQLVTTGTGNLRWLDLAIDRGWCYTKAVPLYASRRGKDLFA